MKEFDQALTAATRAVGWSPEKVAVELTERGVRTTAGQVTRWLKGKAEPRRMAYQALRDAVPGLADLIDGRSQSAA